MIFSKKSKIQENTKEPVKQTEDGNVFIEIHPDPLLEKVERQEKIIRELLKLVVMISEHKNYAYIQAQRDLIINLLDNPEK
jgi:hypothetical protein